MNQGRIWTVVSPTVGLPLFLGSVALMSFTVHFAVLNNSSWMKEFFNGNLTKTSAVETEVAPTADLAAAKTDESTFTVAQAPAIADDVAPTLLKIKPKTGDPDPS
jgi:light-harvesting protein B-800-850 alpha chain